MNKIRDKVAAISINLFDVEPSDGLSAIYKVYLNEKFIDIEVRNEFLQFMQKEFPNTKLIEVLNLIGPS